ncbi:hypothetical protein PFICI_15163 [Pestalotiopsis fici W106-1]|uniref:Enoyl reductase (ER) domain-containing protein n=1 Tax=Pestalotiopsis fici (strain W106-1 / CGMCC3.15140) TaxID=1229662 RepID=W3WH57_PESFW|nr:uncharacterized protein PFICI_15163 [Pestalotiopsis fici W106-1]ETS73218.1 hypothetical protein PFICI_15163 [Pestalotiopsis fici W106-1]
MKAVVINKFVQNYAEVHVSEIPVPSPNNDEILIHVKAAGVNFVDTLYSRGLHQNNRRHVTPPFTLGLEFAGEVISAPASCSFPPGCRVFGACLGAYAEYLALPASNATALHHMPPAWSYRQAASLGATLPVSYGALKLRGALKSGETVLVHSAAGGLGLAAVQLARALGCRVIGTAGSTLKCAIAERFGAEKCINYTANTKWWEEVNRLTGQKGVDIVFDSVGLVSDSLRCLVHRGRLLVMGFAGREGNLEAVKMNRVLLSQAIIIGYVSIQLPLLSPQKLRFGESERRDPAESVQIWTELLPLIEAGQIKPAVYAGKYQGLESVPTALEDIAARRVWGKAVIQISTADDQSERAQL